MAEFEPCPIGACSWPETPHTCTNPTVPCAACGSPVDDEILADAPDCPHGWVDLTTIAVADIKALFARSMPEVNLKPALKPGGTDG